MFSRSMSSTCRQRRLPCQCFPLLCRNLSRLSGVVRPSPPNIKGVLKTSQKCQVTSFCRVFLINALLLPSPRPFDIGASKRAIGLQEYLNMCCKFEKAQNSPFLVLWRKLHVEEVAGQGSHHHVRLLTLENNHCKLPHPTSGTFTWTM